jgi:dephospho-CoA kinase
MRIIIVTGMPGSGKSELADAFKSIGCPVVVMGDVVRNEALKRGLEPNPINMKAVMLDLRQKDGPGAIAKRCVTDLLRPSSDIIIIEGCRSIAELEEFARFSHDVRVICVHSSPSTRFARLRSRGREDAPLNWDSFRERDLRELSVGLGGIIALSDTMIVNEGTLEEFRRMAKELAAQVG